MLMHHFGERAFGPEQCAATCDVCQQLAAGGKQVRGGVVVGVRLAVGVGLGLGLGGVIEWERVVSCGFGLQMQRERERTLIKLTDLPAPKSAYRPSLPDPNPPIHPPTIHLPTNPPIYPPIYPPTHPPTHQPTHPPTHQGRQDRRHRAGSSPHPPDRLNRQPSAAAAAAAAGLRQPRRIRGPGQRRWRREQGVGSYLHLGAVQGCAEQQESPSGERGRV